MRWLTVTGLMIVWLASGTAQAAGGPRYDVPPGFARCPSAQAWHGFFKWASARDTTCRDAAHFMREYAARADGRRMPHLVAGYRCRIYYWRDEDGDIYASRHTCARHDVTIRFYGEV